MRDPERLSVSRLSGVVVAVHPVLGLWFGIGLAG